jgi:hypothetical protein
VRDIAPVAPLTAAWPALYDTLLTSMMPKGVEHLSERSDMRSLAINLRLRINLGLLGRARS